MILATERESRLVITLNSEKSIIFAHLSVRVARDIGMCSFFITFSTSCCLLYFNFACNSVCIMLIFAWNWGSSKDGREFKEKCHQESKCN